MKDKVIIVGSGFGGLESALKLRQLNKEVDIIVIDKKPFFVYQPSLHKLISMTAKKKEIIIDLEKLYTKHNIRFYKEDVVEIKPLEKSVVTMSRKLNFDYLVIGVGGVTNFFGIDGAEENTLPLKTIFDTKKIKKNLFEELEKASHYKEPINIVVAGGGFTGIETAGELADITKGKGKVIIIESSTSILKGLGNKVIQFAETTLKEKGVEIKINNKIKKVEKGKITLENEETIYSNIIIWCCGIKPNRLTYKSGLRTSDRGGIMINEFLQTSHPHIYAAGDCAYIYKSPQPQTALIALKQGMLIAENINADIRKLDKKAFEPMDWPFLISLGKRKAILIKNKNVKTGFIPSIMKKFVQKNYVFNKKNHKWPFKIKLE
ncbi:NAD(P)/FAD-dependent oxidoreductase [archaeon]|nr:NAD(P)/FAD-dependent oxidoreductase [archaeon]MBL7057563.1 NAD(P)/FAD-dependent oxidoreductase [Candidatus Woesearchaeota archaeon]